MLNMRDEKFFKRLGIRIAELRQKQGLSQQALADTLELKQQTWATYESATRRLPSSLLIPLTQILGVSLEELLGSNSEKQKPGPAPKLQKQIEQLGQLPKSKQKFISEFLDTVLQQA
jgi:transcriptional regulator with XRE-family HTH domain